MWKRLALSSLLAAALGAQSPEELDFFETHIRPTLVEQCYVCHAASAPALQGGLRVDTRQALLEGGHSGPAVLPGKPEQSRLFQALSYQDDSLKMPPQGKLPDATIERFRQWIAMGAPDPRVDRPAPAQKPPATTHWAFTAPRKTEPPKVSDPLWARSPIDRFVFDRLRHEGLSPAPAAHPRTLLRRLSYDLTGLPPTFAQQQAFSDDPAAYAAAVDRLLQSPRFGERWGRYWLDIARYSDTGFQRKRFPAAFHYRDWVIEALNADLPYDRFVLLQLAADLVDLGDRPEDLRALGFLTVGINLPRPTDVPENLDDRIDVVSRGFLGLTVACARCHDHKFDPIPTADYYSLYGVFLNSEDVIEPRFVESVDGKPDAARYLPRLAKRRQAIDDFQRERLEAHKAEFRSAEWLPRYLTGAWTARNFSNPQLEALSRERDLNIYLLHRWRSYLNGRIEAEDAPWASLQGEDSASALAQRLAALDRTEPYSNPAKEKLRLSLRGPGSPTDVPFGDFAWIKNEGDSNVVKNLTWQYNGAFFDWAYRGGPAAAMALRDRSRIEPAHIFVRGNQHDRGAEVPQRFLAALSGPHREPFQHGSGRLELARAIASTENPLTARVAVNRIWQRLFGQGIVRTPSDFGSRGDPPTHPELLDRLAVQFVEDGWSVKRMIRRIVLSEAYRQQSADRPEARAKDPENKLLWRANRRRLDFEALRDSMLAVAGRLDERSGGPSFLLDAKPATPRRTIYSFIDREAPSKMMKSFDFSNPEQHTAQRIPTTVPQQALFLMNSPFAVEQARHIAERAHGVQALYRAILGRDPSKQETDLGREFIEQYQTSLSETSASPWQYGFGRLDPRTGAVKRFRAFAVFAEDSWRESSMLPARKAGHAHLTAGGGAPGPGLDYAVVRRWVSPIETHISISGALTQNTGPTGRRFDYSNGIHGRLVSDRQGLLGFWALRDGKAETAISGIEVRKGETLSFVVDDRGDDESDDFTWAVTIDSGERKWNARADFRGPAPQPLTAREAYAQLLLGTNEFIFVD